MNAKVQVVVEITSDNPSNNTVRRKTAEIELL